MGFRVFFTALEAIPIQRSHERWFDPTGCAALLGAGLLAAVGSIGHVEGAGAGNVTVNVARDVLHQAADPAAVGMVMAGMVVGLGLVAVCVWLGHAGCNCKCFLGRRQREEPQGTAAV